jgi:nucleoside-diphosphate-sugar epimerase
MSGIGGTRWRVLPTAIAADELGRWFSGIPWPLAVTGATGFVGSHLLDALLEGGAHSRVLVRDPSRLSERARANAETVLGDLDDRDALARLVSGCGGVVHLAGLVRAAGAAHFDRANRVGTENLVIALREHAPRARLVHLSSLAAAGPSEDPVGRRPEDPPRPVSAYGRSKLAGEAAVRAHGGGLVILRPPAIYGPRDVDVLQFFRLASRGVVPIPSGERWLTVAYVADVVRGILAALAGAGDGRVLNLGEPAPRTLRSLIGVLAEAGGVRARCVGVPPVVVKVAGLGGDLLHFLGVHGVAITSDKARELLARHWSARTSESLAALGLDGFVPFDAGAAQTWSWYRDRGWVARAKIHTRPRPSNHAGS